MEKRIRKIPATKNLYHNKEKSEKRRRRVAAYARVSTDHEDQVKSCRAQVDYYTRLIKGREDWDFVRVYTDEGITGTSIRHRSGFRRMVEDALNGQIDLIVTKSVSRFARNTVDCLTTIRMLKEHGVECFFEKEGIRTFDGKGELFLTIMSSIAQEEARTISENCTWGQRKRLNEGKVTIPFSSFLGFMRGPNGELLVDPGEAAIVRRIYSEFLSGRTCYGIAKSLTRDGIPTPMKRKVWNPETIRHILTNEKYKGDALLQKSFTVDYLTKKRKVNQGEVPQIYVEGNHEAIISPEMFERVQEEMKRRRRAKNR